MRTGMNVNGLRECDNLWQENSVGCLETSSEDVDTGLTL